MDDFRLFNCQSNNKGRQETVSLNMAPVIIEYKEVEHCVGQDHYKD